MDLMKDIELLERMSLASLLDLFEVKFSEINIIEFEEYNKKQQIEYLNTLFIVKLKAGTTKAQRKKATALNPRFFKHTYVADFETDNSDRALEQGKTRVTSFGICEIGDIDGGWFGTSIEEFFEWLKIKGHCKMYFHNLKFDGGFIIDYLLKHGYTNIDKITTEEAKPNTFSTLITDDKTFYYIDIVIDVDGIPNFIRIADSMKLLNFSVRDLGNAFETKYRKLNDRNIDWDYSKYRPIGYEYTKEEIDYQLNDVRVVAEAIGIVQEKGFTKDTIAACAMQEFRDGLKTTKIKKDKKTGKEKEIKVDKFRKLFPKIEQDIDTQIRQSYRGGLTFVKKGIYYNKGNTFDVNSLYPSMLHSNRYTIPWEQEDGSYILRQCSNYYPTREGVRFEGQYEYDNGHPLYITKIKVAFRIKKHHIPFIQIKNSGKYGTNEYISDTEGCKEELTLCDVDLEMFFQQYDILGEVEYLGGWKFAQISGVFDNYINKWINIKKTTTDKVERQIAKLKLNSLYGKFGESLKARSSIPYLSEYGVRYKASPEETKPGKYLPVAIFCTAYARRFTLTHGQANYDMLVYIDTDSLHLLGMPEFLKIDSGNLCCWKHESCWDMGKFLRQKTYLEHITHENNKPVTPYINLKCATMPKKVKERFITELETGKKTYDNFDTGLKYKISDKLNLTPKTVDGGILLYPAPFELH